MNTINEKLSQLELLRNDITSTISNWWLFPTSGKVKGFLGTGDIMFVGERPSTGEFGSRSDLLLYTLLEKYGVADAHLTDIIKTRGKVGERYPDDIAQHRRVFDREMEIVKPRLVIAFGQKVHDLLLFSLANTGVRVQLTWHYAYTRRGKDKKVEFENQIRQALE